MLLAGARQKSLFLTIINIEHPPPMHNPFNETDVAFEKYVFGITTRKIYNFVSKLPNICAQKSSQENQILVIKIQDGNINLIHIFPFLAITCITSSSKVLYIRAGIAALKAMQ